MKNIKLLKIGKALLSIGVIVWLVENFYFGWNKEPMSNAEEIADIICIILFKLGFIIFLIPIFDVYENAVKKLNS